MKKREMKIAFDLDCMPNGSRQAMEEALQALLHEYGWSFQGSGADCGHINEDGTRHRDIALQHCPDTDCKHWDGRSGCDAVKGCVQ